MKKIILLFVLVACTISSCQRFDYLSSKTQSVNIDGGGGKQNITLYVSQSWAVNNVPEWVTITPANGNPKKVNSIDTINIEISANANNSGNKRSGSIRFATDGNSYEVTVNQAIMPTQDGRNILAIFSATNNLYSFALEDINEMEYGWDDNCNGRLYVLLFNSSGVGSLYLISHDEDLSTIKSQVVKTYPTTTNPNDPIFIRSVIDYVNELYPANSKGLILWSHGSGWLPAGSGNPLKSSQPISKIDYAMLDFAGYEKQSDGPMFSFGDGNNLKYRAMEMYDLASALDGVKFDFIYFDACYMATIESSYQLRKSADYILASVSETLATGAPYKQITSIMFEKNLDIKKIAQTCFDHYNKQTGELRSSTYSVVKTSKLEALAAATKATISPKSPSYVGIQQFGRSSYRNIFFDFEQFITERWNTSSNLAAFKAALDEAIIFKVATPTLFNEIMINKHCGVTCYIPQSSQVNTLKIYRERYDWSEDSGLGGIF